MVTPRPSLKVFISYRHEDDAHKQAVRALADKLASTLAAPGVEVVLDQHLLERRAGGPLEGWPKWSASEIKEADRVVMIASPGWTERFVSRAPVDSDDDAGDGAGASDGTGYGTAWEAHLIYQELYRAQGKTDKYRVCLLNPEHVRHLPTELAAQHRFFWPADESGLCSWIRQAAPAPAEAEEPLPPLVWPDVRDSFQYDLADREPIFDFFTRMLAGQTEHRIVLIKAQSNHGKSALLSMLAAYATDLVPHAAIDLRGIPNEEELRNELNRELRALLPGYRDGQTLRAVLDQVEEAARHHPVLLLFDTYEKAIETLRTTLEGAWLNAVRRAGGLCIVIAGQDVPGNGKTRTWGRLVEEFELTALERPEDWYDWALARYPQMTHEQVALAAIGLRGVPGDIANILSTFGKASFAFPSRPR